MLRKLLQPIIGDRDRKVVVIFSATGRACDRIIEHVRRGVGTIPIWVYSGESPSPSGAAFCERVIVERGSLRLFLRARRELFGHWVALSAADWTGGTGYRILKLAPFTLPPFRMLLMNENGDFFPGAPALASAHARRRMRNFAVAIWNRAREIHRGAWLFLFAYLAQWFSFLSRYAFNRLERSEHLEITPRPPGGTGVLRIEYEDLDWDWKKITTAVTDSDARWVLFKESRAAGSVTDMLPLFDRENTFAVARQVGYRGWRKLLFPTAPFRPLQPGEATPVVAPLSEAIVVDREKLLALGIPETMASGSAFLLLYWKAAAAGWRTYCVANPAPVGQLAERSFEEAEFVKTLWSDRALGRLAPRQPALARGNIAFQSAAAKPFRALPRVLLASPYLPYPLSHGGAVRIYNLCRELRDRVDFILVCFREKDDHIDYERLHEVFREVYVVDIDEKHHAPALPAQVNEYESSGMRALLAELCRTRQVDLMQLEYTQLAAYRNAAPHVPAILVEHDLTFTLYRQFAEQDSGAAARLEYERWLRFEREWMPRYNAVWVMSEQDRRTAIAEGSPVSATLEVPNGVDLDRFTPQPEPVGAPEILYVGSFRHRPNMIGFEQLIAGIMPRVWARFPEARLRVVGGPEHDRHWTEYHRGKEPLSKLDPRIEVHGFVEDLVPLYAKASVVAVPLVVSAGTNIKVMEALACERAVVSTPVGCQGLGLTDGVEVLIRDPGPRFADALCELLGDRQRRDRLASNGRLAVERRFGWRAIAGRAYANYLELLDANSACSRTNATRSGLA